MKSAGIREAKARLSELARAAAKGEVTILTDYGKPIAMISSIEQASNAESGSDAGEFRKALLCRHVTLGFLDGPSCPAGSQRRTACGH